MRIARRVAITGRYNSCTRLRNQISAQKGGLTMPVRTAQANWKGDLRNGRGEMTFAGGAFQGQYSFASRFEEGPGTNPDELIAAAHAGCFSMAFSGNLTRAGFPPQEVETRASVTVEKGETGFRISHIHLDCEASVPGIDEATFQQEAKAAKQGCPVSVALSAVDISLTARLR
jgi:lipoyl-dependent peroxiredoxin